MCMASIGRTCKGALVTRVMFWQDTRCVQKLQKSNVNSAVRQANGLWDHRDFNSAPRGEPRHTYQFFGFTTITSEMLAHARCARMIFSQEINHARTYVRPSGKKNGYGTPGRSIVRLPHKSTTRGSSVTSMPSQFYQACHTSTFKWAASRCRVRSPVPNFFFVHRPSSSTTSIACLYICSSCCFCLAMVAKR